MTNDTSPSRLGFAVKVLGRDGLKSNDARRWQNEPHLSVSLGYLRAIFAYLAENNITMYRMSSDLAPYATHPDLPQFHSQIRECADELATLGAQARAQNLRLSFHPSQFVVLNSPDPALVEKSVRDLVAQAEMLDGMGLGPEAVVVIHVGGTYGDHRSGCDRWVETWHKILPEPVRRRLVLENDDIRFSAADVLDIHERTGVRLIFDYQHFWCNNPEGLELRPTVQRFLGSWPVGDAAPAGDARPKIHFSSPNTNMREIKRRNRETKKPETVFLPPIWTGHADFLNPFEFITFLRDSGADRPFDVMLEAKAKDLALLRIRRDLARYAPNLAARFGVVPNPPGASGSSPDPRDEDVLEEGAEAAAGEE